MDAVRIGILLDEIPGRQRLPAISNYYLTVSVGPASYVASGNRPMGGVGQQVADELHDAFGVGLDARRSFRNVDLQDDLPVAELVGERGLRRHEDDDEVGGLGCIESVPASMLARCSRSWIMRRIHSTDVRAMPSRCSRRSSGASGSSSSRVSAMPMVARRVPEVVRYDPERLVAESGSLSRPGVQLRVVDREPSARGAHEQRPHRHLDACGCCASGAFCLQLDDAMRFSSGIAVAHMPSRI
jgi:hypothetical protein